MDISLIDYPLRSKREKGLHVRFITQKHTSSNLDCSYENVKYVCFFWQKKR